MNMNMINWDALKSKAEEASKHSYSPYSDFPVGAAAFMDDGRIVSGCNVENASYGLTLCAECSMVSEIMKTGGGKITAFICVDGKGDIIMPCGRCRQLLAEHAAADFIMQTPKGLASMADILPMPFGRDNL